MVPRDLWRHGWLRLHLCAKKQLHTLLLCWLLTSNVVFAANDSVVFAGGKGPSKTRPADVRVSSDDQALTGNERRLQIDAPTYRFFDIDPYVNLVVVDTSDPFCDVNYTSPPVTNSNEAGYPADGTDSIRKRYMSCGVVPARFVFYTSDVDDYEDTSIAARMQVRITCRLAFFIEGDLCNNVLDATGGFPSILSCRFMSHEASFTLATRLRRNKKYSISLKMVNPPVRSSRAENSYTMTVEFYQMKVIEGTRAPIAMINTIPNAKNPVYTEPFDQRGYITAFTWSPGTLYSPVPGVTSTFTFGLRSFGTMGYRSKTYKIDVVAYPTDVWRLGAANTDCDNYASTMIGTTCRLLSFEGADASQANGFRLAIGSTALVNRGSDTTFSLRIPNPRKSANMHWTATSFFLDTSGLVHEPYTILLDKPISVLGEPQGYIARWELASINTEHWVTMEFSPRNTLIPSTTTAGILVIIPPDTFSIIVSSAPQTPPLEYNALPCDTWPETARAAGRWMCTLSDKVPFSETVFRVRLRVRNPTQAAAARSWRVELWQDGNTRPISITRGIVGMPISGTMTATVQAANQLLGGVNMLKFEFVPSQDIGLVARTRLEVQGPPGFFIIKRCLQFTPTRLPSTQCLGSDANRFSLIFTEPDAIKANTKYIFELQVDNPSQNVPIVDNIWVFNTVRPDGVGRDTARYDGFLLYPFEFASFNVVPLSRRVGPQFVICRFIPKERIPFDDYVRIRAPLGANWNSADLGFDTSSAATDANAFTTRTPTVVYENQHFLEFQLTSSAEANFEYGVKARIIVPSVTPVPNRWWVEQYRQTGRNIASYGAAGFQTQVLINALLEPYNIVKEAWNNPTLITFEGTMAVFPITRTTLLGIEKFPAEVYLEAPPRFTYICPLSPTVYMPRYTVPLPSDVQCSVNYNLESEKNKLHLYFPTGIEATTRYAFTVEIVNAPFVDPVLNTFRLMTRIEGKMVEEVSLPGYALADRMDNTRYAPVQQNEDRRVEASNNRVTFVIGTTKTISVDTILEVKAPLGFSFPFDCSAFVGHARWAGVPNLLQLPTIEVCQNRERISLTLANIADISMKGPWVEGTYAIYVTVKNPAFTPARNFWGFTLYDRSKVPQMSEAWVYGFPIQVIMGPDNSDIPTIVAYNPGITIPGQAAQNFIDVSFRLTTRLPPDSNQDNEIRTLKVTAPTGFAFPRVCEGFQKDLRRTDRQALPYGTTCEGDGAQELTVSFQQMRAVLPNMVYAFRVLIVNPTSTLANITEPQNLWRLQTLRPSSAPEDRNFVVPGFVVYDRLLYFVVNTLSRVGLAMTTLRFHFRMNSNLLPQQVVKITPPMGTKFGGIAGGTGATCIGTMDPMLIKRQFPEPIIAGVTRLPEWTSCKVPKDEEILLRNEEPILGGRPLMAGPVYEFFVRNVTNAQETPMLNYFLVEARTDTPLGKEVWAADSWVIKPGLEMTRVTSSNPGKGLYTTFGFRMYTISEVPERGSVEILAPADYYFGPVITNEVTRYNTLAVQPPPQGASPERPPPSQVVTCAVMNGTGWSCPFDFHSCRIGRRLQEEALAGIPLTLTQTSTMNQNLAACTRSEAECNSGKLDAMIGCRSEATNVTLNMAAGVVLPPRRVFQFNLQGYNARTQSDPIIPEENSWHFVTRDSDSERTILDEKSGIPGFKLLGAIFIDSIVPSATKVKIPENRVVITIRLSVACAARAIVKLTFPTEFMRTANAQGSAISPGKNFPAQVERRQSLNELELEALEEDIPANVPMEIIVELSNGDIAPTRENNIWTFQAISMSTGTRQLLNVNYDVEGFKIFGEFSIAQVRGIILAPLANNIIAVWFNLKSDLLPLSEIRVYMPEGWTTQTEDGPCQDFSFSYNKNREYKDRFPVENRYIEIPSGTYCDNGFNPDSEEFFIKLRVEMIVTYGFDYAFEFGVVNPRREPRDPAENVWRFETLKFNTILHLQNNIPGFRMEEIEEVTITPSDTTSRLPLHMIQFFMRSNKYLPGGSKIYIDAPSGFIFRCAFFRTVGLSSTTTCYVVKNTQVEFTLDSQDPKPANSQWTLFVNVVNPEFTPQNNWWNFEIKSPLKASIDKREFVTGFDVTNKVEVDLHPTFAFIGKTNPLRIFFKPYTIMNQADNGNEIVVIAPTGYIFPTVCGSFRLAKTMEQPAAQSGLAAANGYPSTLAFPPPGITCTGFNNGSVVIRLPDGKGLIPNNYTLTIDVENPAYEPAGDNLWEFETRVRNPMVGQRIVDANRTLNGFLLQKLVPVSTKEGSAAPRSFWLGLAIELLICFANQRRL